MHSFIWKTSEGRKRLNDWYDRFVTRIAAPVESLTVETRFGASHVLVGGPKNGRPLVCLHAMRTGASFLLSELGPVLDRFRVFAPDIPGQSIRGADIRLPLDDDSSAQWLIDIMNGCSLGSVNVFGVSWGGYIARLTASTVPERVSRLGLMVPAGIANGSHATGLMKLAFPMLRYRLSPTDANLRNLLSPIMTTWDEQWANYTGCAIRDMKMEMRIPPLASDRDLKKLTMPTLALVAEHDISFPATPIMHRLRSNLPSADVEVIEGCKHCPPTTPEFQRWLGLRLSDFFDHDNTINSL